MFESLNDCFWSLVDPLKVAFMIGIFCSVAVLGQSNSDVRVVRAVAPVYPDVAISLGLQGSVFVRLSFNQSGELTKVEKLGGDKILYNAAIIAAKKWDFAYGHKKDFSVVLKFSFIVLGDSADRYDLAPVFLPPYEIESRAKRRSVIDTPNIDPKLKKNK
jgi:TonB family protein